MLILTRSKPIQKIKDEIPRFGLQGMRVESMLKLVELILTEIYNRFSELSEDSILEKIGRLFHGKTGISLIFLIAVLALSGCAQPQLERTPEPVITTTPHLAHTVATPSTPFQTSTPSLASTPSTTFTPTPTPTHTPTPTPTPTQTPFKFEYGVKYKVMVIDVVDGDTIDVILPDGSRERVRMLGIDTPETTAEENKPNEYDEITDLNCLAEWGLKAKQYTSKLEGKYVWIELDSLAGMRGYYGRLLAYVYYPNQNTDFTAELVKLGYARVYTEGTFGKESEYLRYQDTAMESGLGLWGACTVAPTPTQKGVLIAYVNYDAPGNDNYNPNGEYVVIRNYGADPVNLIGWKLRDEAGHTYIFPDYTLESGETVYVHSGKGTDSDGRLYWGSSHAIWNNGGDTAYLYDSTGKLVDSYSW